MKLLVLLCVVSVATSASPMIRTTPGEPMYTVETLKFDNDNTGSGNYKYAYEQSDGTRQEQTGEIKNKDTENAYIDVKGVFSWIAPNGIRYTITYVANEDGYQPEVEEGPGTVISPDVLASMTG